VGNINFNISKLPESPIFWIFVAILVFVGLLASGHPATAFTLLFICVFAICLISAINSDENNTQIILGIVCFVCLFLVVILCWLFVPGEWNKKEEVLSPTANITEILHEQSVLETQS